MDNTVTFMAQNREKRKHELGSSPFYPAMQRNPGLPYSRRSVPVSCKRYWKALIKFI